MLLVVLMSVLYVKLLRTNLPDCFSTCPAFVNFVGSFIFVDCVTCKLVVIFRLYCVISSSSNLYDTTPELTPAILDALGHLTLAPDSLEDVRHSVLKSLQAARPEQLPVVVKFLLHNTPQTMAYQV